MIDKTLTKLPDKWYIKQNTSQIVCDWFNKRFNKYAHLEGAMDYLRSDGIYANPDHVLGYQEISFEQFKNWILEPKPNPILNFESLEIGKIYTLTRLSDNGRWIFKKKSSNLKQDGICDTSIHEFQRNCFSVGSQYVGEVYSLSNILEQKWFNLCDKYDTYIPEANVCLYDDTTLELKKKELVGRYVQCVKTCASRTVGKYYKILSGDSWLPDEVRIEEDRGPGTIVCSSFNCFELMPIDFELPIHPPQAIKLPEPKFKIGKWYNYDEHYIKVISIDENHICGEGFNTRFGGFTKTEKWSTNSECAKSGTELINLDPIQKYLPEGHIDKIKPKTDMLSIQEQCKKKYPIGCTYKSPHGGGIEILIQDSEVYMISNGRIFANSGKGYLYDNGKWAELLPSPLNIKKDDWVVITKGHSDWGSCMDSFIGKIVQITKLYDEDRINFNNDGGWIWRYKNGHFRKAESHEIPKPVTPSTSTGDPMEYAKKMYPIGTKYIALNNDGKVLNSDVHECKIEPEMVARKIFTNRRAEAGYIYARGKWAEIVSKAEIGKIALFEELYQTAINPFEPVFHTRTPKNWVVKISYSGKHHPVISYLNKRNENSYSGVGGDDYGMFEGKTFWDDSTKSSQCTRLTEQQFLNLFGDTVQEIDWEEESKSTSIINKPKQTKTNSLLDVSLGEY